MSRIKDFYNFTKKLPIDINSISSLDLRNMFSKSLGVQKYYRGMILTPAQLAEDKNNKKIPIEKVESFVPFIIRPNYIKSISSV
ncbi:hypothetical protein IJE86_05835 [bacterium]|nr:hypothetical protein [bacterium]